MRCSKCNGQSVYCSAWSEDTDGRIWDTWFCPNCGHSYITRGYIDKSKAVKNSKSVAPELPDEIVINGIKYRKV